MNNVVFYLGVLYLGSLIQWSVGDGDYDRFFSMAILILFSLTVLLSEIKNKGK